MRVPVKGIYLKYHDVGEPVIGPLYSKAGKVLYAFNRHNDRTCFVSDWTHLKLLMEVLPFSVVGAEVDGLPPAERILKEKTHA